LPWLTSLWRKAHARELCFYCPGFEIRDLALDPQYSFKELDRFALRPNLFIGGFLGVSKAAHFEIELIVPRNELCARLLERLQSPLFFDHHGPELRASSRETLMTLIELVPGLVGSLVERRTKSRYFCYGAGQFHLYCLSLLVRVLSLCFSIFKGLAQIESIVLGLRKLGLQYPLFFGLYVQRRFGCRGFCFLFHKCLTKHPHRHVEPLDRLVRNAQIIALPLLGIVEIGQLGPLSEQFGLLTLDCLFKLPDVTWRNDRWHGPTSAIGLDRSVKLIGLLNPLERMLIGNGVRGWIPKDLPAWPCSDRG